MKTCQACVRLILLFVLGCGVTAASRADQATTLGFFRVVSESVTLPKTPSKYELVTYTDFTGKHEAVIERQPAHEIPSIAVESVTVRKTKKFDRTAEKKDELTNEITEGNTTKNRSGAEKYPSRFFYNVTFKIRPPEGKEYVNFVNRNIENRFALKIEKKTWGVIQYGYPYDEIPSQSVEFTIYLPENDPERLKQILSPIADRISWE